MSVRKFPDTEVTAPEPGPGKRPPTELAGLWRITEMQVWDRDAFDSNGPAHLNLGASSGGTLRFCFIEAGLDGRYGKREGRHCVEFSWNGYDGGGGDGVQGRGWAALEADGTIAGRVFLHQGDDSGFRARRPTVAEATEIAGASQPRSPRRRR